MFLNAYVSGNLKHIIFTYLTFTTMRQSIIFPHFIDKESEVTFPWLHYSVSCTTASVAPKSRLFIAILCCLSHTIYVSKMYFFYLEKEDYPDNKVIKINLLCLEGRHKLQKLTKFLHWIAKWFLI